MYFHYTISIYCNNINALFKKISFSYKWFFISWLNRILGFLLLNFLITFLILCVYVCMFVHMNIVPTEVRGQYQSYFSKKITGTRVTEVVGCSMWILENELYSLLQVWVYNYYQSRPNFFFEKGKGIKVTEDKGACCGAGKLSLIPRTQTVERKLSPLTYLSPCTHRKLIKTLKWEGVMQHTYNGIYINLVY